jgi:hypothetical protein
VAGRLSSPRFRRRALKLSGLAVVAGSAALVAVLFWNTGRNFDTPVRPNEPGIVPEVQQNVALSVDERRQVLDTAARFVRTAVRRERTVESFDLVSAELRSGYTRRQWANGDIPVQPYPVDAARWKMDYTYGDEVGLSVYVIPDRGEELSPMVFLLSLTRAPSGAWLVDSWVPRPGASPSSSAATQSWSSAAGPAAAVGTNSAPPPARSGRMSGVWLAVPFALLLSGIAFGLLHMAYGRRANVRAERAYRAERSSSSSRPS